MNTALKNIFVRVIRRKMIRENKTAEDIVQYYTKLTSEEKAEILTEI